MPIEGVTAKRISKHQEELTLYKVNGGEMTAGIALEIGQVVVARCPAGPWLKVDDAQFFGDYSGVVVSDAGLFRWLVVTAGVVKRSVVDPDQLSKALELGLLADIEFEN